MTRRQIISLMLLLMCMLALFSPQIVRAAGNLVPVAWSKRGQCGAAIGDINGGFLVTAVADNRTGCYIAYYDGGTYPRFAITSRGVQVMTSQGKTKIYACGDGK